MADLFQFGPYTVREATEDDRKLLEEWIAADPDHAAKKVQPEFFYEKQPGVGCYLLCDAEGPIYFWKTSNVVRLDAQFGPSEHSADKLRNRDALIEGMDWLARMCAAKGATEILFDSVVPLLRRLAIRQMGCEAMPGELVRSLELERLKLTQPKPWGNTPHTTQPERG